MTTIDNDLVAKLCSKYYCEKCDYTTSKKSSFDKHIESKKHQKGVLTTLDNDLDAKLCSKKYSCKNCKKIFNDRAGLWRHNKKCIIPENGPNIDNPTPSELNVEKVEIFDLVKYLMKENGELKNMMMDQQNKMMEQQNMMIKVMENGTNNTTNNTINTNSHNKAFNLNFFLNETCKDAMNIMDFVESIQLQLSDLEKVGELGYVEGISNIIVKNLKEMDVTQRPVHCTDKKRETIYIKDENKWEKDDEKNKIRKMIKRVASKNQRLLLKFKEMHPDCIKYHSKYSDQYNKLIVESMGGSGNNDLEKEDKIIRNIAKSVVVDK
jgi:hypothetical protein